MKKMLAILGALGITASASTSVISCGNDPINQDKDKNLVEVSLLVTPKEDVKSEDLIKSINALEIKTSGTESQKIEKSQLVAMAAVRNVTGVSSVSLLIKDSKAENFEITVKVLFEVKDEGTVEPPEDTRLDISTLDGDLGEIYVKVDEELNIITGIALGIVNKNPDIDLDAVLFAQILQFKPDTLTENSATMTVKRVYEDRYKGELNVTFVKTQNPSN